MMSSSKTETTADLSTTLRGLLNLKNDTDFSGTEDLIRSNVDFKSANAWTLVFAMLIASVGLNMNSTAVIIGAMLISPLMGPIVGTGYALGVFDFELFKRCIRNLGFAVTISLVSSTVYFLLTPMTEVQSELLARTRPSFYDVLIAFFGGAAGIVAMSRREKGNAIPGVAIATALMPPLCTAGYGLATRHYSFALGALYLFLINAVFISVSTFVFVRYLRFPRVSFVDGSQRKRVGRWITGIVLCVMIPSIYMAWFLKQETEFLGRTDRYIEEVVRRAPTLIMDVKNQFRVRNPKLSITYLGGTLQASELEALRARAVEYALDPASIEFVESAVNPARNSQSRLDTVQARTRQLESELFAVKQKQELGARITQELSALFGKSLSQVVIDLSGAHVMWLQKPSAAARKSVEQFLKERMQDESLKVGHNLSIP